MGSSVGSKNATSTGTNTGQSTTTLSPQVQAAYTQLLNQFGGLSNTSATNPAVSSSVSGLGDLSSASNPNFTSASNTLASAAQPASQNVSAYLSPYLNGALSTQQAVQQNQNAQQQQQLVGNAIQQGALGGNRVGVAQAALSGQQDLANNQANSALINSAYQQAQNAALQGQSNLGTIGQAQAGVGTQQNQASLANLLGLLQGGQYQQTAPYTNLGTLASTANALSNNGATISSQGTTTSSQPQGNTLSQLLGTGLSIASLFNAGGRVGLATGGAPGFGDLSDALAATMQASAHAAQQSDNDNQANDNSSLNLGSSPLSSMQKKGAGVIKGWFSGAPIGNEVAGMGIYADGGAVRAYAPGGYVQPAFPDTYDLSDLWGEITRHPFYDPTRSFSGDSAGAGSTPAMRGPSTLGAPPTPGSLGVDTPTGGDLGSNIVDLPNMPSLPQGLDRTDDQGLPYVAPPKHQPDQLAPQQLVPRETMSAPGGLGSLFATTEQAYGLPPGYLSTTAGIESNYNPNANNGVGKGLFQFTDPTAKQYGLGNPYDPVASTEKAAQLAADNATVLQRGLGRPPTAGELYLAHQQGDQGALNLLTNPDSPAASIVGESAVVQNGGSPNMTAGQFAQHWLSRFAPSDQLSSVQQAQSLGVPPAYAGATFSNQTPQNSNSIGDVFKSLQAGHGLGLSNDMRQSLLAAGLGMMSSKSPFALAGIGEGGLAGLQAYNDRQALNRENATAASSINSQQASTQQAARQLQIDAARAAADIGQAGAQTDLAQAQTASARYVRTPTAAGLLVYDVEHPDQAPRVIPWNQMTQGFNGSAPNGTQPEPSVDQDGFTTQATPDMGGGTVNQLLMNPNPEAQKLVYNQTGTALDQAQQSQISAQQLDAQLGELGNLANSLPSSGMLAPGAAFDQRLDAMKGINSALTTLGLQPLDPNNVASAEGMRKLATQLQFAVADQVKTDPAASTIAKAGQASPSGENTIQGFRRIVGNLQALNKRSEDRYSFLNSWAQSHYGDLTGADATFNKLNPPQKYVQYGEKVSSQLGQAPSGTRDNPLVPKSQDEINSAPKGTVIQDPSTGKLFVK